MVAAARRSFAVVQLCSCAVVQLCSCAVVQLCCVVQLMGCVGSRFVVVGSAAASLACHTGGHSCCHTILLANNDSPALPATASFIFQPSKQVHPHHPCSMFFLLLPRKVQLAAGPDNNTEESITPDDLGRGDTSPLCIPTVLACALGSI
jgi:hypothetical protein